MTAESRERMVSSAAALLGERDGAGSQAGDLVAQLLEHSPPDDPIVTLRRFVAVWRAGLETGEPGSDAPPFAADRPRLGRAAVHAFHRWEEAFATTLRRAGLDLPRARRLATIVVAALESAVARARSLRDTRPLAQLAHELEHAVRDALPAVPAAPAAPAF